MTVFITGCSSGIGLATAQRFVAAGHKVIATMRTPEAGPAIPGATVLRLDVTDDASVRDAIARAGSVDVLVNNAGIGGGGPVELTDMARAKRTFETNYFGALRMMQAVLPFMRERRSGVIVNVTSMAGRVTLAAHSHYAASKAALEALSECTALEVAPFGIRVAIIEPGVIMTPIFSKSRSRPDSGPYDTPIRRLRQLFAAQLERPTMPDVVAEVILDAVESGCPQLRYIVGNDADHLIAARRRMTDEEWIRLNATENDEEFFDELHRAVGVDLYRREFHPGSAAGKAK